MKRWNWFVVAGTSLLLATSAWAGKDGAKEAAKGKAGAAAKGAKGDDKPCDKPCDTPCDPPCADDKAKAARKDEGCCPGKDQPKLAAAFLGPTAGNKVKGVVRFAEADDGKVTVSGEFEGLNPGQQHAFHVHEFGDCSAADAMSAGGHYNPEGHEHGLPEKQPKRHAGDFGNVNADAQGKASFKLVVDNLTVAKKNGILGRSVIVHVKADDGGQPTGNAGGRAACGVIGVAKP
jgi:Cu-Zn family superoxide dismutase